MHKTYRTVLLPILAAAILGLALAGCSSSKPNGAVAPAESKSTSPALTKVAGTTLMSKGKMAAPNAQMCATCAKGIKAGAILGAVDTKGGAEVVNVDIKDGTYTPNRFTAKAGAPINVVFTVDGKPAKGCLASPTFKGLGKSAKVTTGSTTLRLGKLSPGSYTFTCGMGMNEGRIEVE